MLSIYRMLDDYLAAINSMHKLLYRHSEPHKIAFIGELDMQGKYYAKMVRKFALFFMTFKYSQ